MKPTLSPAVREIVILTVAGRFGVRFELYAHEIMATAFGIPANIISSLAAGGSPGGLSEQQAITHSVAVCLITGHIVPDSTYKLAVELLGQDGVAELFFLIGSYTLIAMILNGFDMPAPDNNH